MKPEDFKVGEAVAHISLGDGVVTGRPEGEVCVTYPGRGMKRTATGRYDRRWFELHPGYLFHRSVPIS